MQQVVKINTATVDAIAAASISFTASLRAPGGCRTFFIEPKDVPAFISDPDQWAAGENGVSKEEHLEWVETDGTPRCGATTKNGRRCRNFVGGGVQRSIKDWLRLDGGYCSVHSGEGSDRARH